MSGPGSDPGELVVVATPIGNLGDLSARAKEVLAAADLVCCEDTRRTRALLSAIGVPAGRRLVSLHGHNEAQRVGGVLEALAAGRRVALVSDAGTPLVSDPGQRLVAAAVTAGVPVRAVPGPSAALAALVVSGLPADRFVFEGFLPRRGGERGRRLAALAAEVRTAVLYEAPTRLAATLAELAGVLGDRPVAVARELTKLYEEVWRGGLDEAARHFAGREVRGEIVLVLGGAGPPAPADDEELADAVRARLAAGDGPRDASVAVAEALGVPRRRAYEMAIALRRHDGG
ncbi:MAG TPA: 16S rRNA (cytidine(1402)-2'-O)-methyltransferase [Acidimicrobiales bacterium]|nr:16S rRNA (cytidine(1402)-2'-O)-methyltransferase [Acidimicrobiales bacterium]